MDIDTLERQIDAEFSSVELATSSWERLASYVLLAHGQAARALFSPDWDTSSRLADSENRKYGVMHALRFLQKQASRPLRGRPAAIDPTFINWASTYLSRAVDYDSVVSGFTQWRDGTLRISSYDDVHIEFVPVDAADVTYDVADQRLHMPVASDGHGDNLARHLAQVVFNSSEEPIRCLVRAPNLPNLLRLSRSTMEAAFSLPKEWEFSGASIGDLRNFWAALQLLGLAYLMSATRRDAPQWDTLMWLKAEQLCAFVHEATGLDISIARDLLDRHMYDRETVKADIALTPFVASGAGFLVASPELLATSNFERNFYTTLARTSRREVDSQSHLLESSMVDKLRPIFERRGLLVRSSVPYTSSKGSGDIDLLVWSQRERFVIAIELKAFIQPGDHREVINRALQAERALETQLPKYSAALRENLDGILLKAFGLTSEPARHQWSVGLIMRNYVGRSSLRRDAYWFAPEAAFVQSATKHLTLGALVASLTRFEWLPSPRSIHILQETVRTPSGFRVTVPAYRPNPS